MDLKSFGTGFAAGVVVFVVALYGVLRWLGTESN